VDLKGVFLCCIGGGAAHDPAGRRKIVNIASMSSFHVNRDADYCH